MDEDKAALQATDGTPTGSLEDPEDRPESGGVLGGGKPETDKRPRDEVPQHEVNPSEETQPRP